MKVKIIAEAGSNHNGEINLAFQLVDIALAAKADFVKFQIINPDLLYVPYYWEQGKKIENIVHKRRHSETLTYDEWRKVKEYATTVGIEFTASVFDIGGVDFLIELGVPFIKLASSDLNNVELIKYISTKNLPLIISTGMANIDEIKISVNAFSEKGNISNLKILHCVSVYPCDLKNTNLYRLDELNSIFNCEIGLSDHTMNSIAACVATSKGVVFIEKHFTIDKLMDGFDHKYASSPNEFKAYIKNIRAIERSLLPDLINKSDSKEDVTKVRARRGLYLKKSIKKGDVITEDNLIALRPTNKFNPDEKNKLVGVYAGEDINEYESIDLKNSLAFKDTKLSWKEADSFWVNEMKEKKML
ncbi:N-acetylneuraminate synthase family protein [Psychroflexus sp. MES1-P1E]|uniref:N-acetylneuraminate synthase family protein n=1 Tax=Psychroflexus sp. MES1-P1E TaxID=2058320 RepID=UPI000C7C5933|nr:N-acetylneuraminate synthase family protein [Psychroflexus sp. MES1-P1E]PKG44299.1 hypothetical protein CXF67_00405 [Psychroflexus sp. MES1-P1E]